MASEMKSSPNEAWLTKQDSGADLILGWRVDSLSLGTNGDRRRGGKRPTSLRLINQVGPPSKSPLPGSLAAVPLGAYCLCGEPPPVVWCWLYWWRVAPRGGYRKACVVRALPPSLMELEEPTTIECFSDFFRRQWLARAAYQPGPFAYREHQNHWDHWENRGFFCRRRTALCIIAEERTTRNGCAEEIMKGPLPSNAKTQVLKAKPWPSACIEFNWEPPRPGPTV